MPICHVSGEKQLERRAYYKANGYGIGYGYMKLHDDILFFYKGIYQKGRDNDGKYGYDPWTRAQSSRIPYRKY